MTVSIVHRVRWSENEVCRARIASPIIALGLMTIASAVMAQSPSSRLIAPDEVVLYVHSDLRRSEFVGPLVCALKRVLVAPVSARNFRLPLGPDLAATPTQLDAAKVGGAFIRAVAGQGSQRTFKYLLLASDLKAAPWNFVFALTFGDERSPYHAGVVSTARLDGSLSSSTPGGVVPTDKRVYKLILKSIARAGGYQKSEGCILAFPRNLDDLDRKSAEFCPADRSALVDAGILKAKESDECLVARHFERDVSHVDNALALRTSAER
jgi:predicted Zn-dependent protease